jgi:enamine deaminase RidA (YjgF/YER057c/UK114 family)
VERRRAFSGSPWEPKVGYCRAIRAGSHVYVTGTTGIGPDGKVVSPEAYDQTKRCFEIIGKALGELGASLADVVRVRIFTTDISRWQDIGRAHHEALAAHPPATTMVEVKGLIDPAMLVEIEADAVVGEP